MSVVRGFVPSSQPLTAEEETRFRALAEREANFGPAAMSWIPGLLATLDTLRLGSPNGDGAWSYDEENHWLVFTEPDGASSIIAFGVQSEWAPSILARLASK